MSFKSFDFFQKVSIGEDVNKPTIIGSILSLSAISIMTFLFFRQLIDFYSYHTKTDSVVHQQKNADEQISINMELFFNNAPCNILSLDTVDIMNNRKGDISDTLTKKKYFHKNKIMAQYITNKDVANLAKAVRDKEGCALVGKIKVNQVPGEFHISFDNYRNLWRDFTNQHRDLISKVKLTHSIKSLSLGDTNEKIVKRFELDPNLFFRKFEDINTFEDDRLMNYNYFIKIIPYMLVDENWGSIYYAYSFSLSSKSTHYHSHYNDMPIVTVKYEFSPIMMKVTHLKRDYLHFLTHVSAIIGGVFVVFSIINRISTNLICNSDK